MKLGEQRLSDFIHSRYCAIFLMAVALVGAYLAYLPGNIPVLTYDKGLGLESANLWIKSPSDSFIAALLCAAATSALMMYINRRFNLLRDVTIIFAGLFLILQLALPQLMDSFYSGSLLPPLTLVALSLLYASYNKPGYTRFIFLTFFLLAVGTLFQYAFIGYIPIFLMGCGQMRVFRWRTFLAMMLGMVTPMWICIAFGWVDPANFDGVEFEGIRSLYSPPYQLQFIVVAVATAAIALGLCIVNLVKVFSYNSRSRSYNGFIALLLLATIGLMVVDFTNLPFYMPLLNCCLAFQAGQFFVIFRQRRGYILIVTLVALYLAFYLWWLII